MIKPKRLKKGDTVAIVSPSWGGPSIFPKIYDNGIKFLKEELELKVKEFPTARMHADELYNNPKLRAEDINSAFADKKIKAIFTSIGGEDSIRILKYLDKRIIEKNPKIFMGFSDSTTLNVFINQLNLVSFNGPSIMAGFSQMNNFPECKKHIKEMLFENINEYKYLPYKEWSMKYLDWSIDLNIGKVDIKNKNRGWKWIQGNNVVVRGQLFGGCIDVLDMIRGTEYWPKLDFWEGKILFIETSEEKPSPDFVKYILRNYGIQGIFDKIKGILVGRARDYTEEETKKLEENILTIVAQEFNHPEIPIIINMDFGHTEPQFILPLGIGAEIDCRNKTIKLVENPTTN